MPTPNTADDRPRKNVVLLGSTGSIGRSALDVIGHDGGRRLAAFGLAAHTSAASLVEQALTHRPRYAALTAPDAAFTDAQRHRLAAAEVEPLCGPDAVDRLVRAHGGTIGVRSKLRSGSTFWFELPKPPIIAATDVRRDFMLAAQQTAAPL